MSDKLTKKQAAYFEQELEQDKQQVIALILTLENIGTSHSQYYQLENFKKKHKEIVDQLNKINEIKNA